MKFHFFSKKNLLDEMQEQTMRKIESRGFYVLFIGLFIAMGVQGLMEDGGGQIAGEFIVSMIGALYVVLASIRQGIWDRHMTTSTGAVLFSSLLAGFCVGIFTFVRNHYWPGAVCSGLFTMLLCAVVLKGTISATQRRRHKLDHDDTDEEENEEE